jgi:hypothetical protein
MLPRAGPTVGGVRTSAVVAVALAAAALLTACSDEPAAVRRAPTAVADTPTSPTAGATTAAPRPSPDPSPSPARTPVSAAVRLTGDGIDTPQRVLTFGDTFAQAQPALVAALGQPSRDTGVGSSFSEYGTCPGSRLRVLEFGGGALRVLFGDVDGPGLTLYQWALSTGGRADEVPRASALIGDVTTYEFGVGDTVAELRAGVQGGAALVVNPGDELFGPSFRLTDQSSGFFGLLTGTSDRDTVTEVQGGEGCGE